MAFYQCNGAVPDKKHTTFVNKKTKSLYREELVSSKGFSGIYSTKYHCNSPTKVVKMRELEPETTVDWSEAPLLHYHFMTHQMQHIGDYLTARATFLKNEFVTISTVNIQKNTTVFINNASAHELIFIRCGSGSYRSDYGLLTIKKGDYLVIPKGTIGQFEFDIEAPVSLLIVESIAPFEIPSGFRNNFGQILEHAPYSERDFKTPIFQPPLDQVKNYPLIVKSGLRRYKYTLEHHPFDLVGWDGFHYPFTFNIENYSPAVGKIHLPPPTHAVFANQYCLVCNFVPRLLDFDDQSVPAPYFHSNIDCDEVLYYVSGNFTSRKGIEAGSMTFHPAGIPHGPQPGKIEASVGQTSTDEVAVMIDTFQALSPTINVRETMVDDYYKSWLT